MVDGEEFAREREAAFAPGERDDLSPTVRDEPRVLQLFDKVWEFLGVAAMVTVTVLIFLNASARYILSKSINWADEVVIGLIPWIAMIGLYLAIRRGSVIRIDYFFEKLPRSIRPGVTALTTFISAAAFLQLAVYSYQYLGFFGADLTPYLGIMRGWFTSSMFVGAIACGALFLIEGCRLVLRGGYKRRPE